MLSSPLDDLFFKLEIVEKAREYPFQSTRKLSMAESME